MQGYKEHSPLKLDYVLLPYGMKFLRVLIFAIFATIRKNKFPQKIIPRQKICRKNLLHY